jgi:hypothetical protein
MTDMFLPMLLFAAIAAAIAFLPQYDFCAARCQRFFKHLRTKMHDTLHRHA